MVRKKPLCMLLVAKVLDVLPRVGVACIPFVLHHCRFADCSQSQRLRLCDAQPQRSLAMTKDERFLLPGHLVCMRYDCLFQVAPAACLCLRRSSVLSAPTSVQISMRYLLLAQVCQASIVSCHCTPHSIIIESQLQPPDPCQIEANLRSIVPFRSSRSHRA